MHGQPLASGFLSLRVRSDVMEARRAPCHLVAAVLEEHRAVLIEHGGERPVPTPVVAIVN
jgi:hypothetical protein